MVITSGKIKTRCFDLDKTLDSGQCFRWKKVGKKWEGIIGDEFWAIWQVKNILFYKIFSGTKPKKPKEKIVSYFNLDKDYEKILSKIAIDDVMTQAVSFSKGMRILDQDFFEVLVSFVISQNSNIPKIKSSIEKLCVKFGKKIIFSGKTYCTFPLPNALADAKISEIRMCGVGFRDRYIQGVARAFASGRLKLPELKIASHKTALEKLICFTGIGHKVASCVMSFGLSMGEAFPVDVWVERAMHKFYPETRKLKKLEIPEFMQAKFGKYSALANLYLFEYIRKNKTKPNGKK